MGGGGVTILALLTLLPYRHCSYPVCCVSVFFLSPVYEFVGFEEGHCFFSYDVFIGESGLGASSKWPVGIWMGMPSSVTSATVQVLARRWLAGRFIVCHSDTDRP